MRTPITLAELKGSEYRTVDFYLSKSCNKSCHTVLPGL